MYHVMKTYWKISKIQLPLFDEIETSIAGGSQEIYRRMRETPNAGRVQCFSSLHPQPKRPDI